MTVLLPESSCQQWTWLCYHQGHSVSGGHDCVIARATLSTVDMTVLYCQGHSVSSGHGYVITSVTLSAVDMTVLLPGSCSQQLT